jgi:hypothetical protein
MIEAQNIFSLRDAGYDAQGVSVEPEDIGIVEGEDGAAQIASWEPPRPPGVGWVLHSKCWGEEGDIIAIWARPAIIHAKAKPPS